MECLCLESWCGSKCCKINFTKAEPIKSTALCTLICLLIQFMVCVLWPGCWPWMCALSLVTISHAVYRYVPTSECLVAVGGVGIQVIKSLGPLTLSSLFIPLTTDQDIIIYEAVSKYQVDFTLGLHLSGRDSQDILVPLLKTSSSLSLKDIQIAYKHLKEVINKT